MRAHPLVNRYGSSEDLFLPIVPLAFRFAVQRVINRENRKKLPMNRPTPFRTAPVLAPNLISRSPLRRSFSVVLIALAFTFALSPVARAVDPPPDGGYPNQNTAEGDGALASLTTGAGNTAVGFQALFSDTSGGSGGNQAGNTAIGYDALFSNTTGSYNTANGYQALYSNTTGIVNTANGVWALFKNTTGTFNVACGHQALYSNTTGSENTATGAGALIGNTTGLQNTGNGTYALESNSS